MKPPRTPAQMTPAQIAQVETLRPVGALTPVQIAAIYTTKR
jgi:hypothetical protein